MTFNHFLGTFLPERLEFNKLWPPTTEGGGTGRQFFINTLQISGQVSPIQADRTALKKLGQCTIRARSGWGSTERTGQIWI